MDGPELEGRSAAAYRYALAASTDPTAAAPLRSLLAGNAGSQ